MSDLAPKWVIFAPTVINMVLFKIRFVPFGANMTHITHKYNIPDKHHSAIGVQLYRSRGATFLINWIRLASNMTKVVLLFQNQFSVLFAAQIQSNNSPNLSSLSVYCVKLAYLHPGDVESRPRYTSQADTDPRSQLPGCWSYRKWRENSLVY